MSETKREPADEDSQIDAEVARAIRPWERVLPAEVLDEMGRLLRLGLRNDMDVGELMRYLRPDPVVDQSDKVLVDGLTRRGKESKVGGA